MIKKSKQHLKSVNENYLEHMLVAIKVSYNMLYGSLLALIHGLIPGLFQTSASNKIKELYEFINKKR
ncbi:DUF6356 family protein [Candidatus Pelagibacter sp.]|nr:DUF6356 family protein [Candidatus Pelagibacter sp.]